LALLAASGHEDIRDIAIPTGPRKSSNGVIGRLIAAMRGGY
jgi:hypothetical protein